MKDKRERSTKPITNTIADVVSSIDVNEIKEVANEFKKLVKNSPKFFVAPFVSKSDFALNLAAPIVVPLTLGVLAGVTTIAAAIATVGAAGGLIFASGAGIVGLVNENALEMAQTAAIVAGMALIGAAAMALATVALTLIAAVSVPLTVASIFTRSGATAIAAVSDCFSSDKENQNSGFTPIQ